MLFSYVMIWAFGVRQSFFISIDFPFRFRFWTLILFQFSKRLANFLTVLLPWSRLVQRKARPSPPTIVIIVIMHAKRCANAAVCIYTNRRHRRYQFTCGANIEWKIRDDLPVGLVVGRGVYIRSVRYAYEVQWRWCEIESVCRVCQIIYLHLAGITTTKAGSCLHE